VNRPLRGMRTRTVEKERRAGTRGADRTEDTIAPTVTEASGSECVSGAPCAAAADIIPEHGHTAPVPTAGRSSVFLTERSK
jgi:hypothetical protein